MSTGDHFPYNQALCVHGNHLNNCPQCEYIMATSHTEHDGGALLNAMTLAMWNHRPKYDFDNPKSLTMQLAQAALAAVRQGHVVVPIEIAQDAQRCVRNLIDFRFNRLGKDRMREVSNSLGEALTQHDGAKDA